MKKTSSGSTARLAGRGRSRVIGGIAGVAMLAAVFAAPSAANAATTTTADSCTSGASTLADFTEYGTDIQLRTSGQCGGSVWFRLNGWDGSYNGTVLLQVKTSLGAIVNGPESTCMNAPVISSYMTGYPWARLKFTSQVGGTAPNYTTAWKPISIAAIAAQPSR